MKHKSFIFLIALLFLTGLFSKNSYRKGELILYLADPITVETNGAGFVQTNIERINEISDRNGLHRGNELAINSVKAYSSVCAIDYCGNSSSYTADVTYQGTSPLWKISCNNSDTVIYEVKKDGDIQTLHTGSDIYYVRRNGMRLRVGDGEGNQHIDQYGYRAFYPLIFLHLLIIRQ